VFQLANEIPLLNYPVSPEARSRDCVSELDAQKNIRLNGEDATGRRRKLHGSYVAIFWDIAPCSPYVIRRFVGTYHFHLQGRKSGE
jgi:hypothetical protein